MSADTTRRALLAGTAALTIVGGDELLPFVRAAAAGRHPDAELLALRVPWRAAVDAFEAALTVKSRIDEQVFARGGDYPDRGSWTGTHNEFNEAFRKIAAARSALVAELGGDEADQLEDETAEANGVLVEQIEQTPAQTLAGILFKVEVSEEEGHNRPELIDSIMADIKALASGGTNV